MMFDSFLKNLIAVVFMCFYSYPKNLQKISIKKGAFGTLEFSIDNTLEMS